MCIRDSNKEVTWAAGDMDMLRVDQEGMVSLDGILYNEGNYEKIQKKMFYKNLITIFLFLCYTYAKIPDTLLHRPGSPCIEKK